VPIEKFIPFAAHAGMRTCKSGQGPINFSLSTDLMRVHATLVQPGLRRDCGRREKV
jgi:hypothetical protein